MICSGCGKTIPFVGDVCPYCHRNKSSDQKSMMFYLLFGIMLSLIGGFIFGPWGLLGGFLIGFIASGYINESQKRTITAKQTQTITQNRENLEKTSIKTLTRSADFVAIDFETATQKRSSACAVALAFANENENEIIGTYSTLIRPPGNIFSKINTQIHGINSCDTNKSPDFIEIWEGFLQHVIESGIEIVAHNASFDMSVLRSSLEHYGISIPFIDASCTVDIARELYPQLPDHKLPTVAKHLGVDLKHHDPTSDAVASAKIMIEWKKIKQQELLAEKEWEESLDTIKNKIEHAKDMEKENPAAAAKIYLEAIKLIKSVHTEHNDNQHLKKPPRMPINRLSMIFERAEQYEKCRQIIEWYRKYDDPVGLTKTDQEAIDGRLERIQKKLTT